MLAALAVLVFSATAYASGPPRPFWEDGLVGLRDQEGNVILPPTFDEIESFGINLPGNRFGPNIVADNHLARARGGC